jgi:hypothetical protein
MSSGDVNNMGWSGINGYESDSSNSGNSSLPYTPALPVVDLTSNDSPRYPVVDLTSNDSPRYPVVDLTSNDLPIYPVIDDWCVVCSYAVFMSFSNTSHDYLQPAFVCLGCVELICYECAASSVTHPDSCA